jgi:hypothetical protein
MLQKHLISKLKNPKNGIPQKFAIEEGRFFRDGNIDRIASQTSFWRII